MVGLELGMVSLESGMVSLELGMEVGENSSWFTIIHFMWLYLLVRARACVVCACTCQTVSLYVCVCMSGSAKLTNRVSEQTGMSLSLFADIQNCYYTYTHIHTSSELLLFDVCKLVSYCEPPWIRTFVLIPINIRTSHKEKQIQVHKAWNCNKHDCSGNNNYSTHILQYPIPLNPTTVWILIRQETTVQSWYVNVCFILFPRKNVRVTNNPVMLFAVLIKEGKL